MIIIMNFKTGKTGWSFPSGKDLTHRWKNNLWWSFSRLAGIGRNPGCREFRFLVVPPRHMVIPSGKMTWQVPPVSEVIPIRPGIHCI
jgi:hypothetical protein